MGAELEYEVEVGEKEVEVEFWKDDAKEVGKEVEKLFPDDAAKQNKMKKDKEKGRKKNH